MDVVQLSRMAKSAGLSFSMRVTEVGRYAFFLAPPSWDPGSLYGEGFESVPGGTPDEPIAALSVGSYEDLVSDMGPVLGYYRLHGADWDRIFGAIERIGFRCSHSGGAL